MIDVTGPDGSMVSFPDGTDGGTIHQVMTQHFGGGEAPQNYSTSQMIGNLSDQALRGVPIVGPLIAKGQDALTGALGGPGMAQGEQRAQQFEKQYPLSSQAAGIGGGIAATLPLGASAGAMKLLGMGGGPLLGNIARGAISGAGIGGADALARGTDPATGAMYGGALGGAAAPAGRLVGTIARAVIPESVQQKALGGMARLFKEGGTPGELGQPNAVPIGTMPTAAEAQARFGRLGDAGMPLDYNPAFQSAATKLSTGADEAAATLKNATLNRAVNAPARMREASDTAFGVPPADDETMIKTLNDVAATNAKPLYDVAHPQEIQITPNIRGILSTKYGKEAISRAEDIAQADRATAKATGNSANPPFTIRNQDVQFEGWKKTNVYSLDMVKRGLDDMIESRMGATSGLGKKQLGSIINMKNALLEQIDAQSSAYRQARASWAGDMSVKDAYEAGKDVWNRNMSRGEVQSTLKGLQSQGEKSAFEAGAQTGATLKVRGAASGEAPATQTLFRSADNKGILSDILGPQKANDFLRKLDAEATFTQSHAKTSAYKAGESVQAPKEGQLEKSLSYWIFSHAGGLARGLTVDLAKTLFGALRNGKQAQVNSAMARMMTATGADRTQLLQQVMDHVYQLDRSGKANKMVSIAMRSLPAVVNQANQ